MSYRIKKNATWKYDAEIMKYESDPLIVMELRMCKDVEEQILMNKPPENLINYYTEGMV